MLRARIRVDGRLAGALQELLGAPMAVCDGRWGTREDRGHGKRRSRTGVARVGGDVQLAGWRVAGRISPALVTRRWSSKAMRMRSGWWRGSIYWVLLFWDRFSVSKPLSQMRRSTFLPLQDADPTPSFGGFGFSKPILGLGP